MNDAKYTAANDPPARMDRLEKELADLKAKLAARTDEPKEKPPQKENTDNNDDPARRGPVRIFP